MAENKLPAGSVAGSGPGGRVLKEDVIRTVNSGPVSVGGSRETRSVPLSPIRQTIARRLVEAQHTAALLTTFNEVDMSAVMQLRADFKDAFQQQYGVKLGFMSFFVKACIAALKEIPAINAEIDGDDIVYKNYYDIGVAVSTERGLVVPVVRDADSLSLAGIEKQIGDFGSRARDNKLTAEDFAGTTISLTNPGGIGTQCAGSTSVAACTHDQGFHHAGEAAAVRARRHRRDLRADRDAGRRGRRCGLRHPVEWRRRACDRSASFRPGNGA